MFQCSAARTALSSTVVVGLALGALPARASDVVPDTARLGVMPLAPAGADDEKRAALVTSALVEGLARVRRGPVLSFDEVARLLDASAVQQLMGCDDARCQARVDDAVAVDRLVVGRVGALGGTTHVSIVVVDPKTATTLARASTSFPSAGELRAPVDGLATALLHPDAAARGDQVLRDLKVAVVVDELEAGAPIPGTVVNTCLGAALSDADVQVKSAEQVKRIRARLDPGALTSDALSSLTLDDVDVVLVGTLEHTTELAMKTRYGDGAGVVRSDLAFQLVKVDTGEVVSSVTEHAEQPFRGAKVPALNMVRKSLCAAARPGIEAQLERRLARGVRVSLDVTGVVDVAAAERIAKALERDPALLVARTRVVRAGTDGARIELVTKGRDGVGLALAMSRALPELTLTAVTPTTLTAAARTSG